MFLHIPKTGGTSLIQALCGQFADADCFTSAGGTLSLDLLSLQSTSMQRDCLFYGHAEHDGLHLMDPAQLLTVLRRPEDHAVSHYLFCQRTPGLPLHEAACSLEFVTFLRTHWQALVFQAISLDVVQSLTSIAQPEEFFRRLPSIQAFLDRVDFVGCLDCVDEVLQTLALARGWPPLDPMPLLQTAESVGIDQGYAVLLRAAYHTLWDDPIFAPLLAAEQGIYTQAQRISRRQSAAVQANQP